MAAEAILNKMTVSTEMIDMAMIVLQNISANITAIIVTADMVVAIIVTTDMRRNITHITIKDTTGSIRMVMKDSRLPISGSGFFIDWEIVAL